MYVYNTTYSVSTERSGEWLRWVREIYIPAILATGLTGQHRMHRLLTELDNGGVTYTLQLSFLTREDFDSYISDYEDIMIEKMQQIFHGNFVYFSTLLEEL